VAVDPEAQAQLARLLRDESLRSASEDELRAAIDRRFGTLVEGLVAEASSSDDVTDRETGLSFVQLRLRSLSSVLDEQMTSRLLEGVREKISQW
jgi:hypothetical protein